jgi:hypothetical protein
MKIISKNYIVKDKNGFFVDEYDVESNEEVGWVVGERFGFEWEGVNYSGVVKDVNGIWSVFFIDDVKVI